MRRAVASISFGIVAILVTAGCGSDDDSQGAPDEDPATTTTVAISTTTTTATTIAPSGPAELPDEELLIEAVEAYVAAFGNGDPDAAVSLVSQRCVDTISMDEYRATVAAAGELYPGLVVDEVRDIVAEDDRAVVYYSTDPEVEAGDGERWVIDSGTWAWDDC